MNNTPFCDFLNNFEYSFLSLWMCHHHQDHGDCGYRDDGFFHSINTNLIRLKSKKKKTNSSHFFKHNAGHSTEDKGD